MRTLDNAFQDVLTGEVPGLRAPAAHVPSPIPPRMRPRGTPSPARSKTAVTLPGLGPAMPSLGTTTRPTKIERFPTPSRIRRPSDSFEDEVTTLMDAPIPNDTLSE